MTCFFAGTLGAEPLLWKRTVMKPMKCTEEEDGERKGGEGQVLGYFVTLLEEHV